MKSKRKIAICGAGIAGIAAAYYLVQHEIESEIILIDKQTPLSFTSSKSGENFRDYWPHPSMEALSSHSIDLMQALQNTYGEDAFQLNFSGYHFVSHNAEKAIFADDSTPSFREKNRVETDAEVIHQQHPYLDANIQKSVFIKKAGNVDSIRMGNLMLQQAKQNGVQLLEEEITGLQKKTKGFKINMAGHHSIIVDQIILATGPFINQLANMLNIDLPVWNTLQRKFIIPDPKKVIPQDMPFTIYADGQTLDWSKEEIEFMQSDKDLEWMTKPMPGAIHIKPESGRIKMGWAIGKEKKVPQWDVPTLPYFPQVVLKGASRFIPALKAYAENIPTPIIEYGGYYTRTEENWPLVGPTENENIFVIGALAGFGTMTACAVGELCTQYIIQKELPWYAEYFHPNRYNNPKIKAIIDNLDMDGQL